MMRKVISGVPGFIEPCRPSKVPKPPSGPEWIHEIKYDGFRLMVRREGSKVRCFTMNGHDRTNHFSAIVEAASRIKVQSFLIDGEAVVLREDGSSDFNALRSRRRAEAVLVAFDLIEVDDDDLRGLSLIDRKRRLSKLIGKSKKRAIQYGDYLIGDGPAIFAHVCNMGLEGIVSKLIAAPYRSGPSKAWLKSKNPNSEAVRREKEEDWHTRR